MTIDPNTDWIDEFLSEESDDDLDLFDDRQAPEFSEDSRGDWS